MTGTEHFVTPPELPSPKGEALCRLCASENGGCCRTDPDLTYLSFPLSGPEWRRIIPHAALATPAIPAEGARFTEEEEAADAAACDLRNQNVPPFLPPADETQPPNDAVCAPEPNRPDFIASMHTLFPGEKRAIDALFPTNGEHGALRTRRDGACVFLGGGGCRLPRIARPWYCLLFPAWVIEDTLTLFSSPECLIAQKARGPAHGIRLLDESPVRLRRFYAALRLDWGLPPSV